MLPRETQRRKRDTEEDVETDVKTRKQVGGMGGRDRGGHR